MAENELKEVGYEAKKEKRAQEEIGAPDFFRLQDFESNPYQHEAALKLVEELEYLNADLLDRAECRDNLRSLVMEFRERVKIAASDDPEFLSIIRSLREELFVSVTKILSIRKAMNSEDPAVTGSEEGLVQFAGNPFSLWNQFKKALGSRHVVEYQAVVNENARATLRQSYDEYLDHMRRRLREVDHAISVPVSSQEFLGEINAAKNPEDVDCVRSLVEAYVSAAGKKAALRDVVSEIASALALKKKSDLYFVAPEWPDNRSLERSIGENAKSADSDVMSLLGLSNERISAYRYLYAVTKEAISVVNQLNSFLASSFHLREGVRIHLDDIGFKESLEIGRGRVLTHSAPYGLMREILQEGALLSVEAQAQEKGSAKRTHGIALVKKDYMTDRHSPESHSIAFGVDKVYGNFVRFKEDAPVVIAFSENYFLSRGYLFQESDGEHLLDPDYDGTLDGKPLKIDLKSCPVVFLVDGERYDEFRDFMIAKSAWSDDFSGMTQQEREEWFSERVFRHSAAFNELPEWVKSALEKQSGPPVPGYSWVTSVEASFKGWSGKVKKFMPIV